MQMNKSLQTSIGKPQPASPKWFTADLAYQVLLKSGHVNSSATVTLRLYDSQSPKYLLFGSFKKKFADLCYKLISHGIGYIKLPNNISTHQNLYYCITKIAFK